MVEPCGFPRMQVRTLAWRSFGERPVGEAQKLELPSPKLDWGRTERAHAGTLTCIRLTAEPHDDSASSSSCWASKAQVPAHRTTAFAPLLLKTRAEAFGGLF